jgi:hypothetical protein
MPHMRHPYAREQESPSSNQPQSQTDTAPESYYVTLPKYYKYDVDQGHLNRRAWVLQEES